MGPVCLTGDAELVSSGSMLGVGNWSGVTEAYRVSFASLCAGTMDRILDDLPGPSLLDVGSGTGELARRARARGRTVTAVDADPDMVALTASVGVQAVQAALPNLPLPDAGYDGVAANFVVNHVPDPRAAMAELGRLVRPEGRLAVTIWPNGGAAWSALTQAAFTAAGAVPLPAHRLDSSLDFERSADGVADLARGVGLEPLVATDLTWEWEVSVAALWAGISGGVATVGRTFLAQPTDVRAAIEHEYRERAAALASPGGLLHFPSCAVYLLATTMRDRRTEFERS